MALYVRSSGLAVAPTIVFLHGGGTSGWVWGPVVERLADYHCLVPDLPEHGRSRDAGPFSIRGAAQDVAELLRASAHGGRAHVVGLSIGGQVALELLATAPDLVNHAVLSGTMVMLPRPRPTRPRPRFRPWPRVDTLDVLERSFRLLMSIRDNPLLVRGLLRMSRIPQKYLPLYREDARRATLDGMMRIVTENVVYGAPPHLDSVTVPTLVVVGEDEPPVLHRAAREIVAALRAARAEARVVRGVAHSWNLEAPDRFAEAVRAWIEDRPFPEWLRPPA